MVEFNPNMEFASSQQPKPPSIDPEKELQTYMKAHNCTREEAMRALEKQHGAKPKEKPGMKDGNVDVKYRPAQGVQGRPDPKAAFDACKLQHQDWSDAQIRSYLEQIYGKPQDKKGN